MDKKILPTQMELSLLKPSKYVFSWVHIKKINIFRISYHCIFFCTSYCFLVCRWVYIGFQLTSVWNQVTGIGLILLWGIFFLSREGTAELRWHKTGMKVEIILHCSADSWHGKKRTRFLSSSVLWMSQTYLFSLDLLLLEKWNPCCKRAFEHDR